MLVGDYMQHSADLIVEQGGPLATDSAGKTIYPGRADLHLATRAYDPALRRFVKVKVRLRVTVKVRPFD